RAESWRFSAGQRLQTNLFTHPSQRQPTPSQCPPELSSMSAPVPAQRILIVTDAWTPQVNGVVRTLEALGRDLEAMGHQVRYATPEGRFTLPMPTYPEIRLAIFPRKSLKR